MNPTPLARQVQRRMEALQLDRKGLSKKAKLNETFVRDLLEGRTISPRYASLEKLAGALGCAVSDLTIDEAPQFATNARRSIVSREARSSIMVPTISIDELDVRAAAGAGQLVTEETKVSEWHMPRDLLRAATQAPFEDVKIITIVGDSMQPTFNPTEKVLVDTDDKLPTPPGVFVIWDGLGLVAKRVEHIADSEPPTVRIMSDNPKYPPYERVIGEAHIQGRVIGKWLWT